MKNFKVKLSYLDRLESLAWGQYVSVHINGQNVGYCEVKKEDGYFVGYVSLYHDIEANGEMYFYYYGNTSQLGFYNFDGLLFTDRKTMDTTQLKDMLI